MSNSNHDHTPYEEINKRTPRPEWEWDKTIIDKYKKRNLHKPKKYGILEA